MGSKQLDVDISPFSTHEIALLQACLVSPLQQEINSTGAMQPVSQSMKLFQQSTIQHALKSLLEKVPARM